MKGADEKKQNILLTLTLLRYILFAIADSDRGDAEENARREMPSVIFQKL
jgi:hypothetical protein